MHSHNAGVHPPPREQPIIRKISDMLRYTVVLSAEALNQNDEPLIHLLDNQVNSVGAFLCL